MSDGIRMGPIITLTNGDILEGLNADDERTPEEIRVGLDDFDGIVILRGDHNYKTDALGFEHMVLRLEEAKRFVELLNFYIKEIER